MSGEGAGSYGVGQRVGKKSRVEGRIKVKAVPP